MNSGLFSLRRVSSALAVAGLLLPVVIGKSASANNSSTFQFSFVATASTSAGPSIAVGDKFFVETVFNLDTASTHSTASYGNDFEDSVVSFSITTFPSNTGTWSSQGVVWNISPVFNLNTNANGDSFTLQVRTSAAPTLNTVPFYDLLIDLGWNSSDLDMVWQAGSTTLANIFGTRSPNINQTRRFKFEIRDTSLDTETFTISQPTIGPTTTTTAPPATTAPPTTTAPVVLSAAPASTSYTASNKQATLSWSAVTGAAGYVVTNSQSAVVCETTSTSCVISNLRNGTATNFLVHAVNSAGTRSTSWVTASVRSGFQVKTTSVKAKKSIALSSIVTSPSKGKKTWRITSGKCRVQGSRLVAASKAGTCAVKLSIAKKGAYSAMSTTVSLAIK